LSAGAGSGEITKRKMKKKIIELLEAGGTNDLMVEQKPKMIKLIAIYVP
jgi:hypothetical protein